MMEKIINGLRFEGTYVENCWDVRTWECNGVVERSARQVIEWQESSLLESGYQNHPFDVDPVRDAEYLAEQKEKSQRASARRAKTKCRRFIISEKFDEMLTLTYRQNQLDRDLCKVHFKEWVRRMKRALGAFRYCASFEMQERGAMHIHCATHKLPKHADYKGVKVKAWELGTRIWRDVIGDFPFVGPLQPGQQFPKVDNGLCFVGGKSKFGAPRSVRPMSLAKMAGYVSKYILKDFESVPDEKNRYSRSNGDVGGAVHVCRLNGTLADIVAACFECNDGDVIVSHHVSRWRDSWWLCTESGPDIPMH